MQYEIRCDRMTHNYLKVKLANAPIKKEDPMWDWLFLIAQTKKMKITVPENLIAGLSMTYKVEIDNCDPRRSVNFLNSVESYMFCKHIEFFVFSELLELLDDSENYNDTFFEFQEKYWLSDIDISRDQMYKLLERVHKGEKRQRYWDGYREKRAGNNG